MSRSKIEDYIKCARCFYMDRRLGVGIPPGFPFNLNSAVDTLLKKEFDIHRKAQSKHPLMEQYGIDAIPLDHEKIDEWRNVFKGIQFYHELSGFLVCGGVDDIWQMADGTLAIVDYKSTSKNGEVNLDADWQVAYKRQMEIYQWLLRKNDFEVSKTGYFVYVNGKTDVAAFDGKLEFDVKVIPYTGDDSWVEKILLDARACLELDKIPRASEQCDYCTYRKAVQDVLSAFGGLRNEK